jgi:hypothetical protein
MLKERRYAVDQVRHDFLKAEAAIDRAAIDAANAMATMLQQRAMANLPLGTGAKAIQLMNDMAALIVQARQLAIDVHGELAQIPAEIGIRNYGDTSPCPPVAMQPEPATPALRVVA